MRKMASLSQPATKSAVRYLTLEIAVVNSDPVALKEEVNHSNVAVVVNPNPQAANNAQRTQQASE